MRPSNAYWQARLLLSHGHQLPVDLVARLVASGYDVDEMTRRYAQ